MAFDREHRKIYHARLMDARPFIDSLDFARNRKKVSGDLSIVSLSRLHDILENQEGENQNPDGILSYIVQGGVDNQNNSFLEVSVIGQCRLRCQRCLSGLDYPLQLFNRLLLRDQIELDALDDKLAVGEEEEFDSILADAHLDVHSLLEDEILLSLPIAPKHVLGACQATDGENAHREEISPFAVLAKLKRN